METHLPQCQRTCADFLNFCLNLAAVIGLLRWVAVQASIIHLLVLTGAWSYHLKDVLRSLAARFAINKSESESEVCSITKLNPLLILMYKSPCPTSFLTTS